MSRFEKYILTQNDFCANIPYVERNFFGIFRSVSVHIPIMVHFIIV